MKSKSSQTHIWATLLWIDSMVQLANTNFTLGDFDVVIYRRKLKAYSKHLAVIERDYTLYPNTYTYLLKVKDLIKTLYKEVKP